jgi:TolB-like protein
MASRGGRDLRVSWRNAGDFWKSGFCSILRRMIYQFGHFELDLATLELRAAGTASKLEPQVFALLSLLIENRDRVVSKDEILEKVWEGRVVSDAALSSRIKSARQALGDDGQAQRFIKTVHRIGFRFIAEVRASPAPRIGPTLEVRPSSIEPDVSTIATQLEKISRPSIAVLPFRLVGGDSRYASFAHALPDELITELSRLRWLFVTARGSSFRLRVSDAEIVDIGRMLGVRYCLSGTIELSDPTLGIMVELVDSLDGGIVWAERFAGPIADVHAIRDVIRSRVITALDIRIPIHEATRARLSTPEDLDAWSAYHLGLQHMYRFNRADNAAAARLFEHAVKLDPHFARAQAGLSFVHQQTAFMRYSDDVGGATVMARRCAERGLELDPLDPFVNFTMGRTYWLTGDLDSSLSWLERATEVSPNYAQGIYARAWTEALAGRALEGRRHADLAMRLSPIDPLHYAMLGTRAFTHMVLGEDAAAAAWAERAARSPGAHVLIAMIATAAHELNGDRTRAAAWAANVRERNNTLTREDFCRAFPMKSDAMRTRVVQALAQFGF